MGNVVERLIIHCSDTPASMDIGADTIRDWHVNLNGWSDIGYHYVITRDGTIQLGRDLDGDGNVEEEIGAHAYGYNKGSIGICMIGGRPSCNFTAAQWDSLEFLVTDILGRHNLPKSAVIGHNDVSDKTCPNFDAKEWAKTLKIIKDEHE